MCTADFEDAVKSAHDYVKTEDTVLEWETVAFYTLLAKYGCEHDMAHSGKDAIIKSIMEGDNENN